MRPFSPKHWKAVVYFYPPGAVADAHGAMSSGDVTPGAVPVRCSVQPEVSAATRAETHHSPEGKKMESVYTPAKPPVGVDWLCVWNGDPMVVIAAPDEQTTGDGVLWRTECVRVS